MKKYYFIFCIALNLCLIAFAVPYKFYQNIGYKQPHIDLYSIKFGSILIKESIVIERLLLEFFILNSLLMLLYFVFFGIPKFVFRNKLTNILLVVCLSLIGFTNYRISSSNKSKKVIEQSNQITNSKLRDLENEIEQAKDDFESNQNTDNKNTSPNNFNNQMQQFEDESKLNKLKQEMQNLQWEQDDLKRKQRDAEMQKQFDELNKPKTNW